MQEEPLPTENIYRRRQSYLTNINKFKVKKTVEPLADNKSFFVEYIKNRLNKNNQNFLGLIQGQTGSGKSWASISLAMAIDHKFSMENIVFDAKELIEFVIHRSYKGGAVVFEEAGVGLHNLSFWTDTNKGANKILQTFRHKNLALIMNSPEGSFIDSQSMKLIHCVMSTVGINRRRRYSRVNFHFIKPNYWKKDKPYRNPLRVYNNVTKSWASCTELNVNAPPQPVIEQYERMKIKYTTELNRITSIQLAQKMV